MENDAMGFSKEFQKAFQEFKNSENSRLITEKNRLEALIALPFQEVAKDIENHKHTHYFLKGGRGSTKSSFVSLEIIKGIMENRSSNAVVLRKVGVNLKK